MLLWHLCSYYGTFESNGICQYSPPFLANFPILYPPEIFGVFRKYKKGHIGGLIKLPIKDRINPVVLNGPFLYPLKT